MGENRLFSAIRKATPSKAWSRPFFESINKLQIIQFFFLNVQSYLLQLLRIRQIGSSLINLEEVVLFSFIRKLSCLVVIIFFALLFKEPFIFLLKVLWWLLEIIVKWALWFFLFYLVYIEAILRFNLVLRFKQVFVRIILRHHLRDCKVLTNRY